MSLLALLVGVAHAGSWMLTTNEENIESYVPSAFEWKQGSYHAAIPGTGITAEYFKVFGSADDFYGWLGPKSMEAYHLGLKTIRPLTPPACVDRAGVRACWAPIAVKGKDGSKGEWVIGTGTLLEGGGDRYGGYVVIRGTPEERAAHEAEVMAMLLGWRPKGSKEAPVGTPDEARAPVGHWDREAPVANAAPAANAAPPPPAAEEEWVDEYGYADAPAFDPSSVPDVGRKVPGPCRATKAEHVGWTFVHEITWTYDAAGRETSMLDEWTTSEGAPASNRKDYEYDAAGRLVRMRLSSGRGPEGETVYEYDAAGRLVVEVERFNSGFETRVEHVYDADGRKVKKVVSYGPDEPPVVTTYEYDAAGRLAREKSEDFDRTYTYDAQGRPTSVGKVKITYSDDGRIETREDPGGEGGFPPSTTVTYRDAHGNVLHVARSGMDSSEATYDYACWRSN